MHIYMNKCILIHTYVYIYIRMYMYIYIYIYVLMYLNVYACIHVCIYIHIYIYIDVYIYIYIYICMYIYTYIHIYIYIYIYMYIRVHIYNIYIHTRAGNGRNATSSRRMGGGNPRSRPNTCRRPQIRCVCDLCYTHRCSSEVVKPTVERATFAIA